jgi:hypothetical protein
MGLNTKRGVIEVNQLTILNTTQDARSWQVSQEMQASYRASWCRRSTRE